MQCGVKVVTLVWERSAGCLLAGRNGVGRHRLFHRNSTLVGIIMHLGQMIWPF